MTPKTIAAFVNAAHANGTPADQLALAGLECLASRGRALHAVRVVHEQRARAQAAELAGRLASGANLPLAAVPVVVKDNMDEAGVATAAGRATGAGQEAGADAEVVRRLRDAGAVIVGRANMDELAYGVTGTNPHTGQVRNPRNENRHPGGSSAGSAAAVAADLVPVALGTDTAGSVRIPAALCGVVGMRPTHGRCPTRGVAALAPSLDCVGPITRSVEDAARVLAVLLGEPLVEKARPEPSAGGVCVGVVEGTFAVELSEGVSRAFAKSADTISSLGYQTIKVTIPQLAAGPRASGPIIGAQASHAWARELEEHPGWFGEEVTGHLTKGAAIKAVRYLRAREEASQVVQAIDRALSDCELLVLPTTATHATPIAAPGPQLQFLALTVPFSLGGYPAISVPMGTVDGMPVGLQIVGGRHQDADVIALAAAFERVADWERRRF
ncbi:MAG: amidase [Polyangiaceae bacterium]|jgi:aspartyl-tRNA(Asn)/glutamyl-tRNA(Gln) amidotransferase subunit A|nr:amidase [Polyangiaceae bacterium]